jgi:hypothetical protein
MKREQFTTSVALFSTAENRDPISPRFLERALEFFAAHKLSPVLFTAGGGQFELDDCNVFAARGGELHKWDEVIPARQCELVADLRKGVIYALGLDSPRDCAESRSDWRANVSVYSIGGEFFVRVDEELVPNHTDLVRRALSIGSGLFDLRYGIAYKMPLAKDPESYASGSGPYSFADFREDMRLRRAGIKKPKTPDDLWAEGLNGQRRHLTGLFRGAYLANVLSESHVRGADLLAHPIGKLSQLDASLWLWELSESEIPTAQAMLESKKLLVSQAQQA